MHVAQAPAAADPLYSTTPASGRDHWIQISCCVAAFVATRHAVVRSLPRCFTQGEATFVAQGASSLVVCSLAATAEKVRCTAVELLLQLGLERACRTAGVAGSIFEMGFRLVLVFPKQHPVRDCRHSRRDVDFDLRSQRCVHAVRPVGMGWAGRKVRGRQWCFVDFCRDDPQGLVSFVHDATARAVAAGADACSGQALVRVLGRPALHDPLHRADTGSVFVGTNRREEVLSPARPAHVRAGGPN